MLSPIYTYVFHVVSFLQVSQNPKCITLLSPCVPQPKCNFIHVHKKITKLTTAQHNYIYISYSKSNNKSQKEGQKKFNSLSQVWLWLRHRFSQNTQSLAIIMLILSVKNFTQVSQQTWKFWVDIQVRLFAQLICTKFTDAALIFCKQKFQYRTS